MKTIPGLALSGALSMGILVGQSNSDQLSASAPPQGRPRDIAVTIFNVARVPKMILVRAQRVVTQVFGRIEIGIVWRQGSDSDPDAYSIAHSP